MAKQAYNHIDIFITHSWRYHDDWMRLNDSLKDFEGFDLRNFSVPWYDPGMDPNKEVGRKFVDDWLEGQISPVHVVFFLDSVWSIKSAHRWLTRQYEMAKSMGKPIVGLPTYGETGLRSETTRFCDMVVGWEPAELRWAMIEGKRLSTLAKAA
jgi:hypothetical protein